MKPSLRGLKVHTACLFIFSAVALISCGTLSSDKRTEQDLLAAMQAYNTAFRWENYKAATALVPPAMQPQFWDEADKFHKFVRIMDFEVRSVVLENQGFRGVAQLNCRFYFTTSPTLQSKTISQTWQYLEKKRSGK